MQFFSSFYKPLLASLLLSAPALAFSPAPTSHLTSQEYGSLEITNPKLSPVPARGSVRADAHGAAPRSTKAASAKATHAHAPKRLGQCKARPFDPNASTAPAPQPAIVPPRRHHMR